MIAMLDRDDHAVGQRAFQQAIFSWVRNIFAAGAVLALAWMGETGHDGGFIKDIWAQLKIAGPPVSMVLFLLLIDERRDRKIGDRKVYSLATSSLETMMTLERTVDSLRGAFAQYIQSSVSRERVLAAVDSAPPYIKKKMRKAKKS